MGQPIHLPQRFDAGTAWGEMWEELLAGWLKLLEAYEKPKKSDEGLGLGHWYDVSYWYGERSLTGLLGTAAWQMKKGWSLEEAAIDRVGRKDNKKSGRIDLWFGRGNDASSVEAKIYWVECYDIEKAKVKIKGRLHKAHKQLWKLKADSRAGRSGSQVGNPVTVCYVVPYFYGPDSYDTGKGLLSQLEAWAQDQGYATAKHIARIIMKEELKKLDESLRRSGTPTHEHLGENRNIEDTDVKYPKKLYVYPGVLLVARKEKWEDEA